MKTYAFIDRVYTGEFILLGGIVRIVKSVENLRRNSIVTFYDGETVIMPRKTQVEVIPKHTARIMGREATGADLRG